MILITKTSDQTHVCMVITYSKRMDQPGKVGNNPARGQLNRGNEYFFLSSFAHENLVSRDGFGSPVPRQPAHLHTQAGYGAHWSRSSTSRRVARFSTKCTKWTQTHKPHSSTTTSRIGNHTLMIHTILKVHTAYTCPQSPPIHLFGSSSVSFPYPFRIGSVRTLKLPPISLVIVAPFTHLVKYMEVALVFRLSGETHLPRKKQISEEPRPK